MKANIGIYNLGMLTKGGGEKLTLVIADHLSRDHNVWLLSPEALDLPSLEHYFGVDLSRVRIMSFERPTFLQRALGRIRGPRSSTLPMDHYLQISKLKLDIFINNSYASNLICPAPRGIYVCMFPHLPDGTLSYVGRSATAGESLIDKSDKLLSGYTSSKAIDSYSVIAAISNYTGSWVQKMWGRSSELLYPPCDNMGPASVKEKMLLHVGRFKADDGGKVMHHKNQHALLETFAEMTDLHQQGWQLHFAGSVAPGKDSLRLAATLAEKARDLPIEFHFDSDFDNLRDLYRRSAIYWHATGYGCAADRYPAQQEHFGISTVEAMSAGAVPVVINSGGQKEIVTGEVDGLFWDDLQELRDQTVRLVNDSNLLNRLSRQATAASARFSRDAFTANLDRIVGPLLPC